VTWVDGSEVARVSFDVRNVDENPEIEWATLEDPRLRPVISELRHRSGSQLGLVQVTTEVNKSVVSNFHASR
jgi:hypothetical protein